MRVQTLSAVCHLGSELPVCFYFSSINAFDQMLMLKSVSGRVVSKGVREVTRNGKGHTEQVGKAYCCTYSTDSHVVVTFKGWCLTNYR